MPTIQQLVRKGRTTLVEKGKSPALDSCTVIEVGPCVVTQIKSLEKDGYEALQLGFVDQKEKRVNQPEAGHFKKAGVTPKRYLAEFKEFEKKYNLGDVITVEYLENAGFVDVIGTSKGKGFQGVVKRHHFNGVGERTHENCFTCT